MNEASYSPGGVPPGLHEPLRILHADDSPVMRGVIRQILADFDSRLDSVSDGREALERLREAGSCYALMITDQQMPRMSGLELVRQARTLPFSGAVIVLSAGVTRQERAEFARLGVRAVMGKNDPEVITLGRTAAEILDAFVPPPRERAE